MFTKEAYDAGVVQALQDAGLVKEALSGMPAHLLGGAGTGALVGGTFGAIGAPEGSRTRAAIRTALAGAGVGAGISSGMRIHSDPARWGAVSRALLPGATLGAGTIAGLVAANQVALSPSERWHMFKNYVS